MIIFPAPDVPQFTDTIVSIEGLLFGLEMDGVAWIYEDLQGWTLGGGVETSFAARPGQHGMFDGPSYRRARVISISGTVLADTAALAEEAADRMAATLADGSLGSFSVQNSRRTLSAQVRMSDAPIESWLDDMAFSWSLQFTAPDWRKYAEPQSLLAGLPGGGTGLSWPIGSFFDFGDPGSNGQVTATNSGTAPTEPEFTVTGPLAVGFQITEAETGRSLRYESPVSSDVVIDCGEGTVTSGGQDRTGLLTVDEFFSIPAGASRSYQFSTLGAETASDPASAILTVSPAYH